MRILFLLFSLLPILGLVGCIGTDLIDEPIGEDLSEAVIGQASIVVETGASAVLSFHFLNAAGMEEPARWVFVSADASVATVDGDGQIMGLNTGQTIVRGTANGAFTDSVLVTVVADPEAVAEVRIAPPDDQLQPGDQLQLSAEVRNANGELLAEKAITWNSLDGEIGTIDAQGLFTALAPGECRIVAESEGVSSLPLVLEVLDTAQSVRMGAFSGRNGYTVSGTALLEGMRGNAVLSFDSSFQSQSGPGLRVILSTSGSGIVNGLDLGSLKSNTGAQSYPLPMNSDPDRYSHAFIHCQPFNVPFGAAPLN